MARFVRLGAFMTDGQIETSTPAHDGWDVFAVWKKHEDIAMHFNDLIMRLRTQAIAGVAALSALVGIFAKEDASSARDNWEVAAMVFFGLAIFWVAVFFLDIFYYNKLLSGAVAELVRLEKVSATSKTISSIQLSSRIEDVMRGKRRDDRNWNQYICSRIGIWIFYAVVFGATLSGGFISLDLHNSVVATASGQQDEAQHRHRSVHLNSH